MKSAKFLSVLLIIAMCFGIMATSASAAGVVVVSGGNSAEVTAPDTQPAAPADESGVIVFEGAEAASEPSAVLRGAPKTPYADETVAVIGTKEYKSLYEAVAAAVNGDVVTMVKHGADREEMLLINKSITIDLNGIYVNFPSTSAVKDHAIEIAAGVTVKIKNGALSTATYTDLATSKVYGFTNGIVSKGNLTLTDVEFRFDTKSGGTELVEADAGSITVIGGEYTQDPTAFLAANYVTAKNAQNRWPVTENVPVIVSKEAAIGAAEYATLAEAVAAVKAGETITLLKDVTGFFTAEAFTLDLNSYTLSLSGAISVPAGKTLTVKNGTVTPNSAAAGITNNGTLTLDGLEAFGSDDISYTVNSTGALTLTNGTDIGNSKAGAILLTGTLNVADANATVDDVATYGAEASTVNISAGGFKSLRVGNGATGTVTGNVTGGNYLDGIDKVFIATGYFAEKQSDNSYTVKPIPATAKVTSADGKTEYNADDSANSNYVTFFKGTSEAGSNKDLVFKVEPALTKLSVNGTERTLNTDYTYDAGNKLVTIAKGTSFLTGLPAGKNLINLTFENGAVVNVPLYVYPSITLDKTRYVQGSGSGITATVSDQPDNISTGVKDNASDAKMLTTDDFTKNSNGTITIKPACLDKLATGTQYLGFWTGSNALLFKITVAPAPSITPADANKDGLWYNGGDNMVYTVKPDIQSVTVDGTALASGNYSTNSDGLLTLKSAYLKTLSYAEHTLSVTTSDGTVSTKFTTKPSVYAKNGDTHTKGSTKDLTFISSDPVTKIFVGDTQLANTSSSTQYTLSSDGKTITLKAAFLNTLKADTTYTLTVNGNAGTAKTTFKILSTATAATSPKTGDESNILVWIAVLTLSGAAAVALVPKKKKQ